MSYEECIAYLYAQLPFFQKQGEKAYKPKLHNSLLIDEHLGNPHKAFKTIHIAGTNGKGSSSHFMAAILQSAGYRVGLYTSPHLKDFRERIKINGEMVSKQRVVDFVIQNKEFIESIQPSFFEVSVGMAFQIYKEEKVDVAIIEVGLGGLHDSTNIITPIACLITNIGYDHMNILGNTLEEIAFQKAGIIKPQVPVVISEFTAETKPIFIDKAKKESSDILFAKDIYSYQIKNKLLNSLDLEIKNKDTQKSLEISSGLVGDYQASNILGVIAICDILKSTLTQITDNAVSNGIKNVVSLTGLKGRWQILQTSPLTVCDTGHNTHAISLTVPRLVTSQKKIHFILGFVNDKEVDKTMAFFPKSGTYYFCSFDSFRSLTEQELSNLGDKFELNYSIYSNVNLALEAAKRKADPNDIIFIGGSTFLVAEINEL
ncbi:MAG: bifunctional folylpolyglutamate synthase/dihydrofolate synthase [Leadbetterella sp.]